MAYRVDPQVCIGCGLCTGIAEDVFSMTEDGVAKAVNQPGPGQGRKAQEALGSCPVSAIYRD